jgi:osmoprotectant transport system permease protein
VNYFGWLTDPGNWSGPGSIPAQILAHLGYSLVSLLIAMAIAVPLGIYIGVTGKGVGLIAGVANTLRALPSIGVLILAVMLISLAVSNNLAYQIPTVLVLVLLGIPPMLTNTYAGIQATDASAVDAARGMGYTRDQVLWHVQLPCALPLILSGIRSALLQIISTATIAAVVSLGGLGRFIIDGSATNNYSEMVGGAIVVAAVALAAELLLIGVGALVVSPGLRRTARRPRRRSSDAAPAAASVTGSTVGVAS